MTRREIVITAAIIAVILATWWFSRPIKRENPQENKTNHTSAIEASLQNKRDYNKLQDEARGFGVLCWYSKADRCRILIQLAKENKALARALERAKSNGVSVVADDRFSLGTRWLSVNTSVGVAEIIEFVETNVDLATTKPGGLLEERAEKLGISCFLAAAEICNDLVRKAEGNVALQQALEQARSAGVMVYASDRFEVSNGFVNVDAKAEPQEIVEFLIGKKQ